MQYVQHTCGGGACCRRDYSSINFIEASYCPESFAALETCLDCVKGEENYVHCGPRYTTCLCVWGGGRREEEEGGGGGGQGGNTQDVWVVYVHTCV